MFVASLTIISTVSIGVGNYENSSVEQVLSDESAFNYDTTLSKVSLGESGSISKIESTTGIKELNANEALLIGKGWLNSQEVTKVKSDVLKTVLSGTPVIAINNNVEVFDNFEDKLSYCFDETAFVNAAYYNAEEDVMYCYSGSLETEQKSLEGVSKWLSNLNTSSSLDIVTVETGDWSPSINSVVEKNFGEWGSVNIQNEYRYLMEDNYSYNYYCGLHAIEVVPKSNHRTVSVETNFSLANLDLNNKDRILYSYAPDGTNGVTTVGVNFSIGYASKSGLSAQAGISWSYGVQDITVHNYSNKNEGEFHLVHEFNTTKDAAKETRVIAPGHMVIVKCDDGVSNNGDYVGRDIFIFTFEKTRINNKIEKASFTVDLGPNLHANPADLTIDGNGATGNEVNDGPYTGDTVTWTYSQGSHLLLSDEHYYKTGYRALGYSTNPLATKPTYHFGDTMKITSDTTLYYVWEKI